MVDRVSSQRPQVATPQQAPRAAKVEAHEHVATPAAKAKADALVGNIRAAMDLRLKNLAWMAPETKVQARAKLASLTTKIGYPDKWKD